VYDKAARTLVFDAARLHREPDPHPDAVEAIALPNVPTPATFISGALFIDSAGDGGIFHALHWPVEPDAPAASASATAASPAPTASPAPASLIDAFNPVPNPPPYLGEAAQAHYLIGDTGPGGGIVFYDAGSVQPWGRYLEAAPNTWNGGRADPARPWCDTIELIDGTFGTAIGTGKTNTDNMVAGGACTLGAANSVRGYASPGAPEGSWFLPSKDELNQLYLQRTVVGGFAGVDYWSSSQDSAIGAWAQDLGTGRPDAVLREREDWVRPVRAF
jgi:hypothetical protein